MKPWHIALVVVMVALLAFGYYAVSPLFHTVKVDEALPRATNVTETKNEAHSQTSLAEVVGTIGHPASGTVRIVEADGKTYVRYENFKTINGPDLFVYLAKDRDAKEFVNLGVVKATEGNVNYEIPTGVDISEYPFVLTWCRAFGVLFNYADFSHQRGAD